MRSGLKVIRDELSIVLSTLEHKIDVKVGFVGQNNAFRLRKAYNRENVAKMDFLHILNIFLAKP